MAESGESHGPRCMICQRFFTPDPRQGDAQKLCGRKACRQQYKNQWQRRKYASDLSRSRAAVRIRVRRHRWNKGGGRRAGPVVRDDRWDVAEAVLRLDATVKGLAARTTRCRSVEELSVVLASCLDEGRQILSAGSVLEKKSAVTGHVSEAEWRCNGTRCFASHDGL